MTVFIFASKVYVTLEVFCQGHYTCRNAPWEYFYSPIAII